jgi:phosphate-selective porin
MKRKTLKAAALVALAATLLPGSGRAEEPKESPLVTAARSLKLSGYFQVLAADWDKDVDTFSLRRARASLTGDLVKNLKFKLMVELVRSPALLEAFVEFEPSKTIGLRFGEFKVPFSFENVASDSDLDMVNRPAVVEALVPGRDNGSTGRDIGAVFYGTASVVDYTFGLFNGSGINKADTDSHKDWAGRVVVHPLKFISFGGSLYRGMQSPSANVPLVKRNREGLEAELVLDGFSARGEYVHAEDDLISKAGWYAQAGFFVLPKKLQALLRYDVLDLDRSVAGDAKNVITFGLNWFILGRTKLQVNYEIHRLQSGGREKSGLLAQFQAGF